MEISHIYSLAAGGMLIVILSFRLLHILSAIVRTSHVRAWLFRNLIYPRLHLIRPIPYLEVILQLIYWCGTIASNIVGVRTLREASLRAAKISFINLMPLVSSSSLGLTSYFLGLSLKSITRIHGSVAVITLLEGIFHVVTALVVQSPPSFRNLRTLYGLIASVALLMIVAVLLLRKTLYEVFIRAHIAFAIILVTFLFLHTKSKSSKIALLGSVVCFLGSYGFRCVRMLYRSPFSTNAEPASKITFNPAPHHHPPVSLTQYQYCTGEVIQPDEMCHADVIEALENRKTIAAGPTRIRVRLPRPWNVLAGQYVQLCLPNLGIWSLFQTHPFTIAWWENSDRGTTIDLLIQRRNGFTSQLLELACSKKIKSFPVLIDGPYGSTHALEQYATVLFFADDLGICALLPYVLQLLHLIKDKSCITSRVTLVWRYTNEGHAITVRPMLNDLLKLESENCKSVLELDSHHDSAKIPVDSERNFPLQRDGHTLRIIKIDRAAPFEAYKEHGECIRATEYKGDRTVQSLLASHMPKRAGRGLIAVAAGEQTRNEAATFVYQSKNSNLEFKDLAFSGLQDGLLSKSFNPA